MPLWAVIVLVAVLGSAAYASIKGAPWVPTRDADVRRLLTIAQLGPGVRFTDLGCGDGRMVVAAARAGATATGIEVSLLPYAAALIRRALQPRDIRARISLRLRDFWSADLSQTDVAYVFLVPERSAALRRLFTERLHPGAVVITYAFPIDGWTPETVDTEAGRLKLHRYRMPQSS